MKKIIMLIIICLLTTGCWNYKELDDLGIVTAMGISKDKDNIKLDLQLVNLMEGADNGISEAPMSVITEEAKTIFEAGRKLHLKSSKVFFISDVEYVILSPEIIQNNLKEVLDFLSRDARLSLNYLILTSTENETSDIMSSISQFNLNGAFNISEIIKLSESKYGSSYSLTIKDFLNNYLQEGVTSVIPNIYINGDAKKAQELDSLKNAKVSDYVEIKNLVVFDKNKNIVELSERESLGYNFLNNRIKNAVITCECTDKKNYFTIETLVSKVDYKNKLNDNTIKIDGDIEGEIVYYGCSEDINNVDEFNKIIKISKDTIEKSMKESINKSKEIKTDFIGFGKWIYKNDYKYFDFKNDDWDKDGLNKLNFDYDIKLELYKEGNLRGDLE